MNRLADLLEKKRKAKKEAGDVETQKAAKQSRPAELEAQRPVEYQTGDSVLSLLYSRAAALRQHKLSLTG